MISNNTSSYKLKTPKSHEFDYNQSDDNYENSVEGDIGDGNNKYQVYSRDARYRGIGRARSTEFRSTRSADRRGGFRGGRGGPPSRRGDREFDNLYGFRKYDMRSSDSLGSYRGKFYEVEKKNDFKLNLPEDTRISKLLRRLNSETDQDTSLVISKKLLEVLLIPDNAFYVRKAFHILGESMYEILHVSPGPLAKQQSARALGRMGYIMAQENDFDRYLQWIFNKMTSSFEEIQILLMKSFKETLDMEMKKPILQNHAENLINNLVLAIETTENAEIFKAVLDTLISVVEIYPSDFYGQFRDTIDLLFGWHVDHTQPLCNIEFISKSLERISNHFKCNLEFSIGLIENFLEDITNYSINQNEDEDDSVEHVTVLILALNTVLRCLDSSFHPRNNKLVAVEFVNKCLTKIIKTVKEGMEITVPDNLIIAGNDSICLLLPVLETKTQSISSMIFELLDLELGLLSKFSDSTIISMLLLIAKVIKELSANLPPELIEKLIGPRSEIVALRHSPFKNIQESVICVYQALLNLKNVSLLQEAFRYVLGDLENVYKQIVPGIGSFCSNNPFEGFEASEEDKELTVLFLLRCLSQLANASSIIVMWALKPSILELVGISLQPYNEVLARNAPSLQYSLLYLLYSHCKCYNHFISNSSLVVANKPEIPNMLFDVPNSSPNSGNFAIILQVLYKTLNIQTSNEVTLLLLQWLYDILNNAENYLESLYCNEQFIRLTEVLVKCGFHFDKQIAKMVCENLEKLLSNKQLSWSNHFLISITDLCKLHMNSTSSTLRDCYSNLSVNIPWDITVVEFNKLNIVPSAKDANKFKDYNSFMIYKAQYLHLNGSLDGEMYPMQFKQFMNYLLKDEECDLEDIFNCCWAIESNTQLKMDLFYDLATNSREVLSNWITLEAAQFCVNYKLRTPLGKPNETFTKIESALNQLGNDLIVMKKKEQVSKANSERIRMLLRFIEHLEKCIYNASEGCAVAMPAAMKLVKSFFIANSNTCNEWLSRIRMVVMHTALHCGESSLALRHGQCLLKDFLANNKTNSAEFEKVLIFVTMALLSLKEFEALYGLYFWCKHTVGKRYGWIKCASDQASKKYELAIEGYKSVLEEAESENRKLDSDTQNFIMEQIVSCYKELNNWVDLMEWHSSKIGIENGRKYWFNTTDWDCNKSLFNIEIGNHNHAIQELSNWSFKSERNWSFFETASNTESNLYNVALSIASKSEEDFGSKIASTKSVIQKAIQDHLTCAPSEFLQQFALFHYIAEGLKSKASNEVNTAFLVSENFENEISKIDSSILRKVLWWSEYFDRMQNHQVFSTFCSNLRLDVIKRARKEKNSKLAYNNIYKFFKDKDMNLMEDKRGVTALITQKVSEINVWSLDCARAVFQIIKLDYGVEENRYQTFNLCAAASTSISKYAELFGGVELRRISSKILLKLAAWLQNNEQVSITEMSSPLGKLIMVLPEIGLADASSVIPLNEMAVGKLLQFSVHHCSSLAKAWNAFGTWCYRWGRKIIDSSSKKNNLSEEHCVQIKQLLPEASKEDLDKVFMILSQTRSSIDEEDIDSNEINTSEMIKTQLQCVLVNSTEELLMSLVQIWRSTQRRIYTYYALSAEAYFKYLHLVVNSENVTKSTECSTITVTLRLLRLIVKYALELQNYLEEGLQTTPTQPWKVIIPQLFSRLNHPEDYVRLRVSDLLCRVAEDAPHLITFPAVVGALEGGLKFDFSEITLPRDCLSQTNKEEGELNDEEDYESDTENDSEDISNTLQICFKTMVDTLSKQDPEIIAQVQTLVKELRRITLLWDELWFGTLAQHHSEIRKRQQQLEAEIEKVNDNPNLSKEQKVSLIAEKHRIIIKPIIFVLEQLQDVTSVEAETPHEKQFQEQHLEAIKELIDKLKNPDNPEKPQESLQPLKQLQKRFQQKSHKISSSLKMQDISPILASMKNTDIAMPGLASTAKRSVTIDHVSNIVNILPSKTKPKKLVFYGSDGQTYTYLFKGLEDLHLDERIMQFLSIANTMMAQNADPAGHNMYRARHYSVIPLGPRSGLISWVDGTVPAFALYKRWQQRETQKPSTKNNANTNATILRPCELFYNKLQAHGVKNIENRKEWPLSVLKQVLQELMNETPNDLWAKELWCNSINAGAWWQVVKRYSYSVAVMSIIGYIIGLGDRHLDNMLIDLTTGDVVHIDYNVCFEKGKTLRVPEKVPFRLTPNMVEALGVTGVEGIFRLACENVLKTMRKGRETLLTLLEAFVYDPLIDWTVGGEGLAGTTFRGMATNNQTKQSKKDLEKEVTVSMFNVRCTEMKVEWFENREEILTEIPKLLESLESLAKSNQAILDIEDELQDLHQQLALIKEAEAQGANKHSLYTLPARYDSFHRTRTALNAAKKDLEAVILEANRQIEGYSEVMALFSSQKFAQWLVQLKVVPDNEAMNIFDLVREFLHNAGKDDVIAQCEESESEVAQYSQHLSICATRCLQLIQEYCSLISTCPKSYQENHRSKRYLAWAKFLMDTKDVESTDLILDSFRASLESNCLNSQNILKFAFALDALYKETIANVNKLFDTLTTIRIKDSGGSLEQLYANAKIGVQTFLGCEKGAASALEFVIASELVLLNQNFLTLEIAAHRSGDWLIKLTLREGDWFLNDLVLNSRRAVELISNLPVRQGDDPRFCQCLNGVTAANNVYQGLYDLNFNFHSIILPETMKKVQSEERSVLEMIGDLNKLVLGLGVGIPEVIGQLEKILTLVLMRMDVGQSYDQLLEKVSFFRRQFHALLPVQTENLSSGKMLLMGFNGLFEKLNQETSNLISTLNTLEVPKAWKKLDQVKEAKSISAHIFNDTVKTVLDDIFLLKRIQAMTDFFSLVQDMCQSFKDSSTSNVYNDEQLIKPIKQYTADFISRHILGVTTENIAYSICFLLQHLGLDVTHEIEQKDIGAESKVPLDELYHKGYNKLLKEGVFTQNVLSQASSLESNLKLAWEKLQEPKRLEQKLTLLQSSAIRIQNQLAVYNLMYDDVLQLQGYSSMRNQYLIDFKTETANLQNVCAKLLEVKEKQQGLIEKAHQRLNWAKGANPHVKEIAAAFEAGVKATNEKLSLRETIGSNVLAQCGNILQHEMMRMSNGEAKSFDKLFLSSLEKWRLACQYCNTKADIVTATEEKIMNFLKPELLTDPKWTEKVSEEITEMITLAQKTLDDYKSDLMAGQDNLIPLVDNFKVVYKVHSRLIADVKGLVKTLSKFDEYSVRAQEFMLRYREYMEHCTAMFGLFKKDKQKCDFDDIVEHLGYLRDNTDKLYEGLFELEVRNSKMLVRQDGLDVRGVPKQQSTVTKGQHCNAYAVGVWRRVKMKLEGRDPDPGRKYTAQEQVDYVIREATNPDNLALLYEGWTPWV